MRKIIFGLVALLFVSCASTRTVAGKDIPKWFERGSEPNYAVGSANMGDFQISYDAAVSSAKANLMQKIKATSKDTQKMRTTGTNGKSSSNYERETIHESEMSLENIKVVETYMAEDGTAWVLVYMPML
ncbi:MAG: LPP20 family lipoprotein [Treponema sp.]|nr:LPP20 family lipoprotein [Treponema sp.]